MERKPGSPARAWGASHRWKVLGVGFAANASFAAAFSGIPATAVLLRSGYQLGNDGLGLVLGMLGLGIALSELPWGLLTDRWGDRRVLLLGLYATAAALAAMAGFVVPHGAHVPGIGALAAGLLAVGLLGGSVNGSSGRAVMAWFAEGERGFAMSIRQTAVPTGGGVGALLLPVLATHFGFASVYTVLALLCAVTAGFAWLWLHEAPEWEPAAEEQAKASAGAARPRVSPLRDPLVWRVALGAGALCVPQAMVLTFAAVFLHDFGHAGLATISATLAAVQGGAAVVRVWSGRWTDRRNNRRAYMRGCAVLTALLFAMLALAALWISEAGAHGALPIGLLACMIALGGMCASAWHGVAFTELATLAGMPRAGTALAIGNTCLFMMLFVTPLAIPLLLSAAAWPAVWAAASLCALVALPVFPRSPLQARRAAVRA